MTDLPANSSIKRWPERYLTRLLAERLEGLSQPARDRFGIHPLTALWEAARNLIAILKDAGAMP